MADRIGIIAGGELVAEGTPAELLARTETATLEDAFLRLTGPTSLPNTTLQGEERE